MSKIDDAIAEAFTLGQRARMFHDTSDGENYRRTHTQLIDMRIDFDWLTRAKITGAFLDGYKTTAIIMTIIKMENK